MWSHNKLGEVRHNLLDKDIIEIGGDVDGDMVIYVREAVLRLIGRGSPPITVFITSGGGLVPCGLDIYDILKYYRGEKTGVVHGYARSMAAIILQACQKRQSMRHGSILIHHVSTTQVSLDVLRNPTKLKKVTENAEKDQARLYTILSERTGHAIPKIRRECAKNQSMNTEEALQFGLIDEII